MPCLAGNPEVHFGNYRSRSVNRLDAIFVSNQ